MSEKKQGSGKPQKKKLQPESSQQAIIRMTREAGKLGLTYGQYVAMLEQGAKEDRR